MSALYKDGQIGLFVGCERKLGVYKVEVQEFHSSWI